MFLFYVDMRILIDNALKHLYMLLESLILCKHGHFQTVLLLPREQTLANLNFRKYEITLTFFLQLY